MSEINNMRKLLYKSLNSSISFTKEQKVKKLDLFSFRMDIDQLILKLSLSINNIPNIEFKFIVEKTPYVNVPENEEFPNTFSEAFNNILSRTIIHMINTNEMVRSEDGSTHGNSSAILKLLKKNNKIGFGLHNDSDEKVVVFLYTIDDELNSIIEYLENISFSCNIENGNIDKILMDEYSQTVPDQGGTVARFLLQSTFNSPIFDEIRVYGDFNDDYYYNTIIANDGIYLRESSYNGGYENNVEITIAGIKAPIFNATSDARLKENIVPYSNTDSDILDLPIYKYDFINSNTKNQIGCLAQDLQKICPEIVHEDENGYLSIQESKIVYLLLDEIKRLEKRISDLENNR